VRGVAMLERVAQAAFTRPEPTKVR
jgi:hypothetical protein